MSKIEWTEQTWNPTSGCDRVSAGCDHCYALTMAGRLKAMGSAKYRIDGDPATSGPGFGLTMHPDTLLDPFRRKKPTTYFVNSMSDLFHPDVSAEFILAVWETMSRCPQHTFQVLTKRPQRMARLVDSIAWEWEGDDKGGVPYLWPGRQRDPDGIKDDWIPTEQDTIGGGESPLRNVWLGTSIENDRYTFRGDHLRDSPAAVRFLSLEPLLGPLPSLDLDGIDWVIIGGESGKGARPMHPDWVRDIRDQCVAAEVPFFFKQWGEWLPFAGHREFMDLPPGARKWAKVDGEQGAMVRVGKKVAGRVLDGQVWDQMPVRP